MTHFSDLSECDYHTGAHDTDSWLCPLLAVGWLEKDEDYSTGECSKELLDKLVDLRGSLHSQFPGSTYRGLHECSLCGFENTFGIENSNITILIPGVSCVYIVSGGIEHYIAQHGYLPPKEFLDAVEICPEPSTPGYLAALTESNRGSTSPLQRGVEESEKMLERVRTQTARD